MGRPKKDKTTDARCQWTDACDATLVTTLRACKDEGLQSDSGWKPVVWTRSADALKDSPGPVKTATKCQDHWGKSLKGSFKAVREIRGASGFGWDDGLKMVTATPEVWDALIRRRPSAEKWKTTPFPLYDDILYLVDGIVATGEGAFHPGMPLSSQMDLTSQSQSTIPATPLRRSPRRRSAVGNTSDISPNDSSSSPVQQRRGKKRPPSSSPSTTRKPRKRNAEAASDVAAALERVAASLHVVGSPEVSARAIQLMEDDGDFSENEGANVMMLFVEKSSYAKAFVAVRSRERRTAFIHRALQASEDAE
ncbi:hypothetical protein B0H13DRAFT_2460060 [Mycena leptocephala]|nr:hypothetical protein B0H13DRAFT_2460060 [Mycena leptocephala]